MTDIDPSATPVIAQYLRTKADHKDCLLFFRMGDFYELFFEDAETAAKELDIVLTKRGKYKDQDIPMCGVPVHNYAVYTERLVKKGFYIAVCEQTEDPAEAKKRGSKAVVKRDVVRILTPGTLTEDHMLDPASGNYLVALMRDDRKLCAFRYDMSTGKNAYTLIENPADFTNYVMTVRPAEILYGTREDITFLKEYAPDMLHTYQEILPDIPRSDFTEGLSGLEEKAAILLLSYLEKTQKNSKYLLLPTEFEPQDHKLAVDAATLKNLEIFQGSENSKKYSLLWVLDNMTTKGGARLLSERLSSPLVDQKALNQRYDAIDFFIENHNLTEKIRLVFKQLPDMARLLGRLQSGRGTPADLGGIRQAISLIHTMLYDVNIDNYQHMPDILQECFKALCKNIPCYHDISDALMDEPPVTLKFGGFVAPGFDALLDQYTKLKNNAQGFILSLEGKYREYTGINALKIKHNNVIGYHIDVPSLHADRMLKTEFEHVKFIHKQTLANAIRFTTEELMQLEKQIFEADANFNRQEIEIFDMLCEKVQEDIFDLAAFADGYAEIDLYASHAVLIQENDYTRPVLGQDKSLSIAKLRHPVIEKILKSQATKSFVPNDCHFLQHAQKKQTELWLLSGPNMGGKSTFLRQNALAILLAQAGFYVPASHYEAGIFDRLFSRVGASDNLAKGQSTFMTEMSEMAYILKYATSRSFVILDEVGRGTSTYDGLAVAYATVAYLISEINCLGIFATHYHELTDLTAQSKRVGHLQVTVSEYDNEIIFLHHVTQGAAKKSYGVHVAELAGMPPQVVKKAKEFLQKTDKNKAVPVPSETAAPLFSQAKTPHYIHDIEEMLQKADIQKMSPSGALDLLEKLKNALPPSEAISQKTKEKIVA
ncbi:MAG: DNA mismatch repair protein MutS [Pseudomonadota bacterium]